jgi:hypothetical protein
MTIAGQRLGKHSPGVTLSTIEGHPLLGNGPINTHSRTTEEKNFPRGPCREIIKEQRRRLAGSLRWQGPAAHTKDRPDLSSERAPHKNKTVTVTQVIKIWS